MILNAAQLLALVVTAAAPPEQWWSLKPVSRAGPPQIESAWVRSPIDAFILAKLREQKLSPSAEADRRTLIRRLTFDLHGLPPTPQEVDAFLNDKSADAYAKLIDRLLESPRYGERWGRHWLDVVHYGESHGYDKDKPRPNAWPYRDYVIRSFNDDKPYSRFVEEQLAGDVLFPDNPDGVVATGFIAAGPWDFVGHVELPETKTDGLIARYNDRDDMVMTAMSTFQSLTVHCARCHDHKFDPIKQEDYYRLQAVFAGVDRADRPYDRDPEIHRVRRALLVENKSLEVRRLAIAAEVAKTSSPEVRAFEERVAELKRRLANPPKSAPSPSNGYHSAIMPTPDAVKWVQLDLGRSISVDKIKLHPARPTDFPDTPGFGFPLRYRVEICDDEKFAAPQIVLDRTDADAPNPGDRPVVINTSGKAARLLRITATRLWKRTNDFVFAMSEVQVYSEGRNVAVQAAVTALDSIEAGRWSTKYLTDEYTSRQPVQAAEIEAERQQDLEAELKSLSHLREQRIDTLLSDATRRERVQVARELEAVNERLAALPLPSLVYAAASEFKPQGSFAPPRSPRPIHLLLRGDVKQPGKLALPGALAYVSGLESDFKLADPNDEGTRRAALAKWITDPRNPLTRRSIVNRVWQYHFGRGIVDTPNDFGRMGSPPTHPELLDWLATWFLENGESFKKLHRLILTSSVYRQTSEIFDFRFPISDLTPEQHRAGEANRKPKIENRKSADSDNRYLWRMNRSRLDAESIRDATLFMSGKLDLTMGGPSVQQFFFKDDHSPVYDYTRFDVDSPGACRRSIYRFIVRSVPDPFMESLDCPDACQLTPKRNTTLTALQALSLLNHPFMVRQAEHFAARVRQITNDPAGRIDAAYRLAFGRSPTPGESQMLVAYAADHGLPNACRLLLNSNEFVFVD